MLAIIFGFLILAGALVWYLLRHDHGRKLPASSLWIAGGFGLLAMLLAGFTEFKLLPQHVWMVPQALPLGDRFLLFMFVGVCEEAAKFVPLALFLYRRRYFREHTDGVIYFALCGLIFGLGENIMYTLSFGARVGVLRLIIMPFLHAASSSVLGYYLASMKISKSRASRQWFALACVVVPLLHGLYDFGLYAGVPQLTVLSLMITLLLTLGLFLYFMQANDLDRALAQQKVQALPRFCPYCGHENRNRTYFCENCGRQL